MTGKGERMFMLRHGIWYSNSFEGNGTANENAMKKAGSPALDALSIIDTFAFGFSCSLRPSIRASVVLDCIGDRAVRLGHP